MPKNIILWNLNILLCNKLKKKILHRLVSGERIVVLVYCQETLASESTLTGTLMPSGELLPVAMLVLILSTAQEPSQNPRLPSLEKYLDHTATAL